MEFRIPEGDDRKRWSCSSCGYIHYENPRTVTGTIVEEDGKLLLCRRAIEPKSGLWTIPAGFLEVGESTVEGAVRETLEEAEAKVRVLSPHAYLDIPHISQIYAVFRAELMDPHHGPGVESLETKLFAFDEIPWSEISFPIVEFTLRLYLEDRAQGVNRVHLGTLNWDGEGSRYDASRYSLNQHLTVPISEDA